MNLSKIEAYGFKSFADKFEMKFDKPITAIVGPNGCGKSNVSDAVRWVLGEQSAKIMRGKTMQDLIFNGTEKRKSMSYCEVSLYFDNKERMFPLDLDEVIISRKLYRSGESEYLINKSPSKLKIISDLLREVGLGREGYSIVGQGRMAAILDAKPDDRRAIFEEALGISKFRVRKKETESKLARYRDNMSRLNDIMSELNNQLAPLKRQCETAKKYLDLSEQLQNYEVNAYIYRYDNASLDKQRINTRIDGLQEERSFAEKKQEEANIRYQDIYNQIADADAEISKLHNDELDLSVAVERQSGENRLLTEQIKYFEKSIIDTGADIESDNNQILQTKAKIDELNESLEQKRQNHAELSKKLAEYNARLAEAEKKVGAMRGSAEEVQQRRMDLLDKITERKASLASFVSEKNTLNNRLADIEEQEKEITEKLAETSEEEKRVITQFDEFKNEEERCKKELDEQQSQNTDNEQKLFEATNAVNSLNQSLAVLRARHKYLLNATENYDGYIASVKQLMVDAQNDAALKSKAIGVVANLIKVAQKYEIAIEACLGSSLQNVVTKNEEDAKYLIAYLKQRRYGRITFMPLSGLRSRGLDDTRVLKERGCLGIAEDFVSTQREYMPVVNNLLGATLMVDNIDNAVAISRKYAYSYRIVTLEGEIIVPSGTISGGSRRSESGLLGNERELEELKGKIATVQKELDQKLSLKNDLTSRKQKYAVTLARLNAEYQQAIVKVASYQERISKFGALSDSERNFFKGISSERASINDKLAKIAKNIETANNDLQKLSDEQGKISDADNSVNKEYENLKLKRNALFDDCNDIKLKISLATNNIANDEKDISTSQKYLASLDFDLKEKTQKLETAQLNINDLRQKLIMSSADSSKVAALEKIKQKNVELGELKDKLKEMHAKADEDRGRAGLEVTRINESILKAENELSNIDIALDALQKRMDEVYQLSYSQALQYKQEDFDFKSAEEEIAKLKTSIARLGYVNVNSIQDYQDTKDRYDDMDSQMEDLRKAEGDQQKVLQELTKEMVERFDAGFEVINRNFGEIFKQLFAGGRARLTIEEEEGVSPLDYGIEIEAQPPGKHVQNISALSGGERALSAVAILLAIIKFRPMPFCVLDEIEAPLDDANTERVAEYLRLFSEKTQFIVITHKKPTMEASDVLYGVTMEEKGVSKSVAVKLADAISQIDE